MDELGQNILKYGKLKKFDLLIKLITESTTKSVGILKMLLLNAVNALFK